MKRHCQMVVLILAIALCSSPRLATAQELEKRAIGHSNLRTISPRTYGVTAQDRSEAYPNMDAVKATIEIMGSRNPKIARLKPQDVLDTSILERLEQSGSIRSESAKQ